MFKRKIIEFSDEYNELCRAFEPMFSAFAKVYDIHWKTSPHDMAVWIVNKIVEFEEVKI